MFVKEFFCSGCLSTFRIISGKEREEAPCPKCGIISKPNAGQSKAVFVKGEQGRVSAVINGVVHKTGSFKCRDCSHPFVFDESTGNKAGCPRCRSTNCEPTSPSAFVIGGSRVITKRVEKRTRYLMETWKSLTKLREYREGFSAFLSSLDASKDTKNNALAAIDRIIDEIDADRKARVKAYDEVKS